MIPEEFKTIAHELNTQDNRITHEPLFCVFQRHRIYGAGIAEDGIEMEKFVNAHFTQKAAEQYISVDRHNLNSPFIYVISLHRCDEMIKIRHFLMGGGGNKSPRSEEKP